MPCVSISALFEQQLIFQQLFPGHLSIKPDLTQVTEAVQSLTLAWVSRNHTPSNMKSVYGVDLVDIPIPLSLVKLICSSSVQNMVAIMWCLTASTTS